MSWDSNRSKVILNPRTPKPLLDRLIKLHQNFELPGHIYLASSGTTAADPEHIKLVVLSKKAILTSAAAVNRWIDIQPDDVWGNALPYFHIGGLSILARANLADVPVVDYQSRWGVSQFCQFLEIEQVSLVSIVPRQLHDIVQSRVQSPRCLRAVFVGGGAVDKMTFATARQLGWPLLPTFGCTECSSQIASASLASLKQFEMPALEVLPHLEVNTDDESRLLVKGPSLLSGYCYYKDGKPLFVDPKRSGWFATADRVQLDDGVIQFLGRIGDFVKINGEGVNLHRLRGVLNELGIVQVEILAVKDQQKGADLVLVGVHPAAELEVIKEQFNQKVYPFERITQVHSVGKLPKTTLGKIKSAELFAQLGLEPAF